MCGLFCHDLFPTRCREKSKKFLGGLLKIISPETLLVILKRRVQPNVGAEKMKVAMLRIGIDSGSGGIQGPIFHDGSFDFIPIPDGFGFDERTYGNTTSLKQRKLVEYFPASRRVVMANRAIHFDPEFVTFTYGDPTPPKAGLRNLQQGDMLIFYCGLEGWDFKSPPALYLMGYFEITAAGRSSAFSKSELETLFYENYHVKHRDIYECQKRE